MFAMLRGEANGVRQGIRIVAPNGDAIAWWGEDLRTPGATSFEFDATNLYIVRSRPLPNPAVSVQAFERVPNQPKLPGLFDLDDDDWMSGTMFHAGALRQERGSLRFILERRPSATLWIDSDCRVRAPRSSMRARTIGNDIASVLLALGALALLAAVRTTQSGARIQLTHDPPRLRGARGAAADPRRSGSVADLPLRSLRLADARTVQPVAVRPARQRRGDSGHRHRADESRAAARWRCRSCGPIVALAAAGGYMLLVRNLIDNTRISTVPDHILPISAAQGVLLAALLLFGFALDPDHAP